MAMMGTPLCCRTVKALNGKRKLPRLLRWRLSAQLHITSAHAAANNPFVLADLLAAVYTIRPDAVLVLDSPGAAQTDRLV